MWGLLTGDKYAQACAVRIPPSKGALRSECAERVRVAHSLRRASRVRMASLQAHGKGETGECCVRQPQGGGKCGRRGTGTESTCWDRCSAEHHQRRALGQRRRRRRVFQLLCPRQPERSTSLSPSACLFRQVVRSRTDARIDAADEAAHQGELQRGDMLLEVEGQKICASSVYDAASLLLGPPGETDKCGVRQHVACNRIGVSAADSRGRWAGKAERAVSRRGLVFMLIWNPIQSAQVHVLEDLTY